jgi:diacylglycerol kinase (ATP)
MTIIKVIKEESARLFHAARYSLQGLKAAFQLEASFRTSCLCCLLGIPLAFYFGETGVERALLLGSLFLVLIVELANSAIEVAVDRIGEEPHSLSGRAKDMSSAAVFLAMLNVVVIWAVILI